MIEGVAALLAEYLPTSDLGNARCVDAAMSALRDLDLEIALRTRRKKWCWKEVMQLPDCRRKYIKRLDMDDKLDNEQWFENFKSIFSGLTHVRLPRGFNRPLSEDSFPLGIETSITVIRIRGFRCDYFDVRIHGFYRGRATSK